MAAIAGTVFKGVNGPLAITRTALGATDTLTYISGRGQILVLDNPTVSPVVVTIDGSGSTTISPTGLGGTVDVSAGLAITVAAGATKSVNLDTIAAYLAGTVAVTGGTGVIATLYN